MQIYETNKSMIDQLVDMELREWKQMWFFDAGKYDGQTKKIFLDNAPA